MAGATDVMLSRLQGELEERSTFQDQLVEGAQNAGRDLNEQEMELYTRASERIAQLEGQLEPLRESVRIAISSRERTAALQQDLTVARGGRGPASIEYRSIGAYLLDVWRSGLQDREAEQRVELFHRAAAHQTTTDNPGLLPQQMLGPVLNFIDTARPIVNALGPRQLPSGAWNRPRITQHTQVAAQTGEKVELASRKMIIGMIPVAGTTYGGYVNVSRQNIDWSQPQIMDIVINDLAGQYAIETEEATADALWAGGTAGPVLPAAPTSADVAEALWTAAGSAYAAMHGQGSLVLAVAPDMLGLIGPLFAPINPTNAQSSGFSAGSFGSGAVGAVSGISVVMSAALDAGQALVISTAAAEIYEDRIGALQVVEPSVLGVQVAYAGYFAPLVLEATGVIKITKGA